MSFNPSGIVTLSSRAAYQNPWLRVREDVIRQADGTQALYGVVERPEFAVIVPWDGQCLTLVNQFRYPIGRRQWELPMGTCDPHEPPQDNAARELREETGLTAASIAFVATVHTAAGFTNQAGHIFLATGLTPGPARPEPSEAGMHAQAMPLAQVEAMVMRGELQDSLTLAALGILRLRGAL